MRSFSYERASTPAQAAAAVARPGAKIIAGGTTLLDLMKLQVGGAAAVSFEKVHVRIDKTVLLNVHMDTDEANACGLHLAKEIELLKQEKT